MASYGFLLSGSFIALPLMVAQWIGIFGLRHGGRSGAWWSMAAGTTPTTLGMATWVAHVLLLHGPLAIQPSTLLLIAFNAMPALGSLLFALGFAVHGMRAARPAERLRDLEQLAAAMSEEIQHLRRGGMTA